MPTIEEVFRARSTRALDIDTAGNVLAGDDQSGTQQLYEIAPDGAWRTLTSLTESCTGRYLPDRRAVVVQHDSGGNERGQLSLLDLDAPTPELTDLVTDERFIHSIVDVLPGRVVFATNRRNGTDFDIAIVDVDAGEERLLYDGGGYSTSASVSPDERFVVIGRIGAAPNSHQLLLVEVSTGEVTELSAYDAPANFLGPQWLPDSSGFLFSADAGREFTAVGRYDVAARSWSYLLADDEHDLECWLAPDGSRLAVATLSDGAQTVALHDPVSPRNRAAVDIPGGGVVSGPLGEPTWSPDGARLAMTVTSPTEPGDVWTWSEAGGVTSSETRDMGSPNSRTSWTPSRRQFPSSGGTSPGRAEAHG